MDGWQRDEEALRRDEEERERQKAKKEAQLERNREGQRRYWANVTPEQLKARYAKATATRKRNEEAQRQREEDDRRALREKRAAASAKKLKKELSEFGSPKPDLRRTVPGADGRLFVFEGIEQSYLQLRGPRFWAYVDQSGGPDACWPWHGARGRHPTTGEPIGYGKSNWRGYPTSAHRVAWMLGTGYELPPGVVIDHMCEVTWCVAPHHLDVCSHGENTRRRYRRSPEYTRTPTSFEPPWDDRWYPLGRRLYDAEGNRLEPRHEAPKQGDHSEPADRDEPTRPTIPLGTPGFTMGIDGPPLIPDDEEF